MRRNKGDIVTIIFASVLATLVLVIAYLALNPRRSLDEPPFITPTTVPVRITPREVPKSEGPEPIVQYSQQDQDKLMEKILKRQPLTNNDKFAKASILSILPKEHPSGILYQSSNIVIDYTASADMFQVEINTTDITAAKAEANVWFRARGMSQKGICDLPLMFYINYETMVKLKNSGITFSPIANSC